ncbi:MAG: hypothetical protein ACI8W7_003448 [Gammaproteobacteria bacterium]|jgi:hypothetical protein
MTFKRDDAMSLDQPDALALLDIARETLVAQVLPQLDGDSRYQVLMVANAMAMATRELTTRLHERTVNPASAAQLLQRLYEHGPVSDDEDSAVTLARLRRRLACDLRNGTVGGDQQHLVQQILRADTRARLAVSNPRRLSRELSAAAHPEPLQGVEKRQEFASKVRRRPAGTQNQTD